MNIKEIIKKHYRFLRYPTIYYYRGIIERIYIGYKTDLEKTGISEDLAEELLSREITKIWRHLREKYKWWESLDHDTQTKLLFIVYSSIRYDIDSEIVKEIEKGNTDVVDITFKQSLEILEGEKDD